MPNQNYLDMSDDEFDKQPTPEVTSANMNLPEPKVVEGDDTSPEQGVETPPEGGEDEGTDDPSNPSGEPSGDEPPETPADGAAAPSVSEEGGEAPATEPKGGEEPPKDTPPAEPNKDTPSAIDYEKAYKELIGTPIRANNKDITIDTVEDARRLMQMGANYNQTMRELKPHRKRIKALEQAGITSDDQIDFLIDLHLQKKEAISKLISDSKIDPLDLNADNASNYKPTAHRISDKQFDLDSTLDELQGSKGYPQTLELVTRKWDAASQERVAAQPQLFRYLNDHMENGIGELVLKEIERLDVLGGLSGLTSFEKYEKVGNDLNAKGAFNHLFKQQPSNAPAPGTVVTPPVKETPKDDKLNSQRRAAAPSRSSPAKKTVITNPLDMPDEEFEKLSQEHFR